MKLPRGVPADRLIRTLEGLGYGVIRQRVAMSDCGMKDLRSTPLQFLYTTR